MSAEVLRRAAVQIARDYDSGTDTTSRGWLAVADWLEEAAQHIEVGEESDMLGDPCPTALEGWECSALGQALTVARAYLGSDS